MAPSEQVNTKIRGGAALMKLGPPVHGRVDRNMARIYTVRSQPHPSRQLSVGKLLYLHIYKYN